MLKKAIVFCVTFCVLFIPITSPAAAKPNNVLVEELVTEVQSAINKVQESAERENLPPLDSVLLTLSTQFIKDGSGNINLYLITIEGGASENEGHTLKMKLTPPKETQVEKVSGTGIAEQLASALINAAKAVKKAKLGEPPLKLSEMSANVKFVVEKKGGGKGEFSILPVTIGLGGGLKAVETQEILVTFKGN